MNDHILYLIMRKDLPDNNPGKMMAQAGHLVSDFEHHVYQDRTEILDTEVSLWRGELTFGTKIVLEADKIEIDEIFPKMQTAAGLVYDPTYPYKNYYGETYFRDELVGMWVFVNRYTYQYEIDLLKNLQLHR